MIPESMPLSTRYHQLCRLAELQQQNVKMAVALQCRTFEHGARRNDAVSEDGKRRMISTSECCYEWEDYRTTWVLLSPKVVN